MLAPGLRHRCASRQLWPRSDFGAAFDPAVLFWVSSAKLVPDPRRASVVERFAGRHKRCRGGRPRRRRPRRRLGPGRFGGATLESECRALRPAVQEHARLFCMSMHTCIHKTLRPMCVAGRGAEAADTLAHYVVCRRVRCEVEAVVSLPSRDLPLPLWLGVPARCTKVQQAQAARRIAIACLSYHWARATKWRASGEPARFHRCALWFESFPRIVREVAATVPFALRGARRRRRAAGTER